MKIKDKKKKKKQSQSRTLTHDWEAYETHQLEKIAHLTHLMKKIQKNQCYIHPVPSIILAEETAKDAAARLSLTEALTEQEYEQHINALEYLFESCLNLKQSIMEKREVGLRIENYLEDIEENLFREQAQLKTRS